MKHLSAKDGLHNAHVINYYGLLCNYAAHCKRFMAQATWWAMYHKEKGDWEEVRNR